jgi:hypothetical protein
VSGQVRGQVRDQVYDQVARWYSSYIAGGLWAGWYSYISAFRQLGVPNLDAIEGQELVARHAGWWFALAGVVVLTDRPTALHRDQLNRLHCETGPAIAYSDGWALHYWHGTAVPADLIETGWDTTRILRERNAEIRRCAIERMGWPEFVAAAGLTQVGDSQPDPGNPGRSLSLYDIPVRLFDEPVRVLICTNGTPERDGTTRQFGLTTPASCRTPLEAVSWTFSVPPELYAQMQRAS